MRLPLLERTTDAPNVAPLEACTTGEPADRDVLHSGGSPCEPDDR
ncbi:MAG TPA: hypothetical protein VGF91_12615 [Solirubrobacteraceae bacterium]